MSRLAAACACWWARLCPPPAAATGLALPGPERHRHPRAVRAAAELRPCLREEGGWAEGLGLWAGGGAGTEGRGPKAILQWRRQGKRSDEGSSGNLQPHSDSGSCRSIKQVLWTLGKPVFYVLNCPGLNHEDDSESDSESTRRSRTWITTGLARKTRGLGLRPECDPRLNHINSFPGCAARIAASSGTRARAEFRLAVTMTRRRNGLARRASDALKIVTRFEKCTITHRTPQILATASTCLDNTLNRRALFNRRIFVEAMSLSLPFSLAKLVLGCCFKLAEMEK